MAIKGQVNGKLENIIERMEVGDEGFTLPWALSFEPNEDKYDVFLYVKYPVYPEKKRTAELYIRKIGPEANDYEVDLDSPKDYKWSVGKASYMGADEENIVNIGQVDMF